MADSQLPNASSTPPWLDDSESYPDVDKHSCQLLGPTALIVQGLMGILVILSLIYKRQREKPMRPWKIWLFDVSKQIVGQMFVHGVNVLISDLVSQFSSENACVSYFLNILIDTTLGIVLIYLILHVLTYVFSEKLHYNGFESGVYGTPPRFKFWARQAVLYVVALTTMKFLVIGLLGLFPGLFKIGAWLLSWTWTGDGDAVQVIFVMGIFPIIMNILQFWLIDSIVKASDSPVNLGAGAPDDADREPLFTASSSDDEEDDNDDAHPIRHDLEHQHHHVRSRSRSPLATDIPPKGNSFSDNPYETKSSGSSSRAGVEESHAYPPSLSSSVASTSSLMSLASHSSSLSSHFLREGNKLNNTNNKIRKTHKRRAPPAPLSLKPAFQPVINSPATPYKQQVEAQAQVASKPILKSTVSKEKMDPIARTGSGPVIVDPSGREWEDRW